MLPTDITPSGQGWPTLKRTTRRPSVSLLLSELLGKQWNATMLKLHGVGLGCVWMMAGLINITSLILIEPWSWVRLHSIYQPSPPHTQREITYMATWSWFILCETLNKPDFQHHYPASFVWRSPVKVTWVDGGTVLFTHGHQGSSSHGCILVWSHFSISIWFLHLVAGRRCIFSHPHAAPPPQCCHNVWFSVEPFLQGWTPKAQIEIFIQLLFFLSLYVYFVPDHCKATKQKHDFYSRWSDQ